MPSRPSRSRLWRCGLLLLLVALSLALSAGPALAQPEGQQEPEGLLGPFAIEDPDGVPISRYDIHADTGGWQEWDRKLLLFTTEVAFAATRLLIGCSVWLLTWAFEFGPADYIVEPAADLAQTYQRDVIDRLGLTNAFLLFGAAWCGVQIMRGRTSRGAAELGITLLISAIAATVLARPADVLLGDDGLLGQTRDTAMALASITATHGETATSDPGVAAQPLADILTTTFVAQPHMALNYGTVLDDTVPTACRDAYASIVAEGPWRSEEEPRDRMREAGCEQMADYNAEPTMDRLLGAYLLAFAALLVSVLVLLMVCVLLIAIFSAALYAVLAPVALLCALLPGGGRQLLWRWTGGITKIVLTIIAVCVFVALFALFVQALLEASTALPLVGRFALVDIAALGGLLFHRKLLNASGRAGQRLSRRLEIARIGGTRGTGWMGPSGMGSTALSPISASELTRGARGEINRVTDPLKRASNTARRAWAGAPTNRSRALRALPTNAGNLQRKLSQSRGGRTLMRTAKAGALAGKVAFGATVGAPIAIPKAATAVKAAAKLRASATRTKLDRATATTGAKARHLGNAWLELSRIPGEHRISGQPQLPRLPKNHRVSGQQLSEAIVERIRRRQTTPPQPPTPPPEREPTPPNPPGNAEQPHTSPPPTAEEAPTQARDSAEQLREHIQRRRRPRRPGGR